MHETSMATQNSLNLTLVIVKVSLLPLKQLCVLIDYLKHGKTK